MNETYSDLKEIVKSIYIASNHKNEDLSDEVVEDYVNQILEVVNRHFCKCPPSTLTSLNL